MSLEDDPTGYHAVNSESYRYSVIFIDITSISCCVGKKDIVPVLGFKLKKVDVTGCVAVHPKLKGMLTCVG